MKNIIANLSLGLILSMALASSYAETISEQVAWKREINERTKTIPKTKWMEC